MSARSLLPVIGANLERLMEVRGLSVDALAAASRIDRESIEAIREARKEATAEDLVRLAGALDVAVADLLAGVRWVTDGKGGGEYRSSDPGAG